MNTENTIYELQQLKLRGMLQSYQKILSMPQQEQPGIHHFMAQLSEAEIQSRLHNRTEMYLKLSKLRYDAVLEQVHCTSDRNLSKESIAAISDCGFVKRAENILITGATLLRQELFSVCDRTAGMCFWIQDPIFFNEQVLGKDNFMQVGGHLAQVPDSDRKNTFADPG